jgi:glycine/D-amino acid oxidase-like deaminating enzyme
MATTVTRAGFEPPTSTAYDVVIVGGAVIGSAVAYFLKANPQFDGTILVVERDPTYEFASTTLSSSCIRQQYSNPINVKISQFGVEFIRAFPQIMGDDAPLLGFKENGYLICCTDAGADMLRQQVEMQRELGAHTMFLTAGDIKKRFPYVNVEDLAGGSWGSAAEGWFDSHGLMQGFRQRARRDGAEYIRNEVVDLKRDGDRVTAAVLSTGEEISCGVLVNAAGPRARMVARMASLDIPVEPRKRHSYVFDCAEPIPGQMPNVIDYAGFFVRPESATHFLAGQPPVPDPEAAVDDFETDYDDFEERLWPGLAHRIPQFEAIKLRNAWTGHYAFNTLDHNAIVGPHTEVANFFFANGFSGHGLQQSPAVGRAISELVVHGAFQTLDLSPLSYERIENNQPFLETAVI